MPAPTKIKRSKARRGPTPTNERTRKAKKTPTPANPENRPEPCSTLSPDENFSCDLPTGHTGIQTNHTSADADGRMWLNGTWRGAKAPRETAGADFVENELNEPPANPVDLLAELSKAWDEIVGKKLAKISSPVKIEGLVLTVDTATADVSQQMSFIADRIIHELRALDPASLVHQIALRVKGTLGQSLAIVKPLEIDTSTTEIPEGEIKATVDGQDATIVLDGTTGSIKAAEAKVTAALLPTIAQLEGRIGLAWDDLQDAEAEKKRATTAHKEAQDHLNALVKELVARTRGGKERQLALGEEVDDEEEADPCEGCKKPSTTRDSEGVPLCAECYESLREETARRNAELATLPDSTLLVDQSEANNANVRSIRDHVWLATDGGLIPYEEARAVVIDQIAVGDLTVAPEGTEPTITTCRVCGCSAEFTCEPGPCKWLEDDLCDSKACVAA